MLFSLQQSWFYKNELGLILEKCETLEDKKGNQLSNLAQKSITQLNLYLL